MSERHPLDLAHAGGDGARQVRLSGWLICGSPAEAALVEQHLPRHIELTRSEPGCLAFEVVPSGDPLVWRVEERFRDAASFRAHQARAASGEWGRATAGIRREYELEGLGD